ncbi:MAG: CvpA family protein [Candidatus Omnitrophica bacterium]|nr:CvpA family protein [Candidatus Omnitrophota bacterium]
MEMLKSINWVDVMVMVIAIRIIYISAQTGFVVEFLKTLAALTALFVSFHFFSLVGGAVPKINFSPEILAATAFLVLWMVTLLLCKFCRDGFMMLFSVKAENAVDKWGAVVIAVGRVVVTASMALFLLLLSGQKYLQNMTLSSLSGRHVLLVAPVIYREGCDRVITRLFPDQKKNPAVGHVLMNVVKK